MNPQQFAEYFNTHGIAPPQPIRPSPLLPYDGVTFPIPPHDSITPRLSSPKSSKSQGAIGKKKVESTAQRISKRVQKQMEDYNKQPVMDPNSRLELLEIQIKNLQRVADTSLRRIHENELSEKRRLEAQERAYDRFRQAAINDHEKFRKGIERLAKYCLDTHQVIKTHDRVIHDFTSLMENYTNDTFEKYLDDRCLRKFNEMADKILQETEMTSEEIGEIVRSLGMDEEMKAPPPPPESEGENLLSWDLDEVVNLIGGEEGK